MRLACVTCQDLPDWEVDDVPLHAAVRARGVELLHVPWDADLDWSTLDSALIRTPWDYGDRPDAFLAWVDRADRATRLFHDAEIVRWNLRKTYLRQLEAEGVPLAPTRWLAPGEVPDLDAVAAAWGVSTLFLKPVVGAAAAHTLRVRAGAEGRAEAVAFLRTVDREMILQPYLESVERVGEFSVIVIDGEPTHAVQKIPVPGDYRVQDDFGASDAPVPLDARLRSLSARVIGAAQRVLGRDQPFLYARVDAHELDGGLVLTELEVLEPSLFFRHGPHAAEVLADAWIRRLT